MLLDLFFSTIYTKILSSTTVFSIDYNKKYLLGTKLAYYIVF